MGGNYQRGKSSDNEGVVDCGRRAALSSAEIIQIIDSCLAEGNLARYHEQLWHHTRGVLLVTKDCILALTRRAGRSRYRTAPPNPDAIFRLKRQISNPRHDKVRAPLVRTSAYQQDDD